MRRIKIDLLLESNRQADAVWVKVKDVFNTSRLASIADEKSYIEYEECHHAESPPGECKIIERIEKD